MWRVRLLVILGWSPEPELGVRCWRVRPCLLVYVFIEKRCFERGSAESLWLNSKLVVIGNRLAMTLPDIGRIYRVVLMLACPFNLLKVFEVLLMRLYFRLSSKMVCVAP